MTAKTKNVELVNKTEGAEKYCQSQAYMGSGNSQEFGSMTKDINQRYAFFVYTKAELKLQVRKAITLF